MSKPKVFFRADANSEIGMGHLVRSSALAKMLEPDFEIVFLTRNTPGEVENKLLSSFKIEHTGEDEFTFFKKNVKECDILVLDGYQFKTEYQKKIKQLGIRSVTIDDLHDLEEYNVDLIINQADLVKREDYKAGPNVRFCLGPDYALLRQPFIKAASEKRESMSKITSVFVSFGGADAYNVTQKVMDVLLEFEQLTSIHVLTGPVNKNSAALPEKYKGSKKVHFYHDLSSEEVCELMKQCQLALVPSSSLSLEVCSVGMVMITGTTADNQEGYYKGLMQRSAALGVGDWLSVKLEEIRNKVMSVLIYDEKDISWFVKNQRAYIDGRSGERLKEVFLKLAI